MKSGFVIEACGANGQWYVKGTFTESVTVYESESAAFNSRECWNYRRALVSYRIIKR